MVDRWLQKMESDWEREMRRKRTKVDNAGAAQTLTSVHERLTKRLDADWHVSAARDVFDVSAMIGPLSIRVRRHNKHGRQWRCVAWAKGGRDGLCIAEHRASDAVDALAGVLDEVAKLWEGLGEVLASIRGGEDG